jgi:PAS domain-containing protein
MAGPYIDYAAVYQQLPIPVLLLTPEHVIADVNQAYLEVTGRTREELLGRDFFDAFPDNPADPRATGARNVSASFARVVATGKPDAISLQQYDVEVPARPGLFAKRYWWSVHAPVFGPAGQIVLIACYVEEVTERVRRFVGGLAKGDVQEGAE